jgi:glycerol-3-phosphate dehydrogenase subunit C
MKKQPWPTNHSDVCIRCATCTAVCPVARVTPQFPGPKQAGPGAERFREKGKASVDEWIDLCIGCHLCDMVCSSGVNISELNLMAKAKYLDEKGRPLRDWLLTHTHLVGPLGTVASPVANFFLRNPTIRWLLDKLFKIDRRRKLPGYEAVTFRQWFKTHVPRKVHQAAPPAGRAEGRTHADKKVAYFYGCYTNTNEPDVGRATVEVLEATGIEVSLPPQKCCGIPMLGNGDFRKARKLGLWNVPSLLRTVRAGSDLIFSSTSCGHMIKHEYSRLLSIPGAEEVADHTFDLFEHLRNRNSANQFNLRFKAVPLKAAYFAPCHLKSLGIGFPALEILRLVPGLKVENIDADCCGLGGTYGFKKEKYEISQEIGKDLAEAVSRIGPEIVLTDCEGCRLQIRHLTGLKVLHPIQVLRDALS